MSGIATSVTSMHQRVASGITGSVASIRDGYRHSRRTGNVFYAIEDLPKTSLG
jgi:hypothetical protein